MIGTLPASANPRHELRERLAYLLTVEIPRLEAEVQCESEIAAVALDHSQQEVHDIVRLQAALDACRSEARTDNDLVQLNDCVTIRAHRSRKNETMIVHDHDLRIRAQGFISVDSPLGAAVVGRRVGESVDVHAPGATPRFVIERVGRA
jgi:transcription elongation factor GreA